MNVFIYYIRKCGAEWTECVDGSELEVKILCQSLDCYLLIMVNWLKLEEFLLYTLKVPMKRPFYYLIQKSFQNDKEWRLFYCNITLACRVIPDFDLCKLDYLWRHRLDTKWCTITKNGISLKTFSV